MKYKHVVLVRTYPFIGNLRRTVQADIVFPNGAAIMVRDVIEFAPLLFYSIIPILI